MSVEVKIKDGRGTSYDAQVGFDGDLHTSSTGLPYFTTHTEARLYRDYFLNSAGSNSMVVDGSVNNQQFTINADEQSDRYISKISFVIADDGAQLNLFGAEAALINGVEFYYEDQLGKVIINEGLTTNWDFVRLAGGQPAFGTGVSSFKAPNVEGKVDAYIPVIDIKVIFGFTYGLRLQAGSSQRIVLNIRDNIVVDSFNAIAYGFDRLKDE